MDRHILCIDLKSFFASCECVDKGLDPFTYPLVVANPTQGNGAMTLAVTPYLKTQGVKSRCRLYEIPRGVKYFIAKPRMNLYLKKSKEVVNIYLDFVASEDLHVYSIDECFLDVTHYLKMYKKTDYELALEILDTVYRKTGLTATCGIGPNMLLAKISMDIEAKHNKDCIAKWTFDDVKTKLWSITPLSSMWGIGARMQHHLNVMGAKTVGDIAKMNPGVLKDKFGVIGLELWNHANGIDNAVISDFNMPSKEKSYSESQVLFRDYNENSVRVLFDEMVSHLTFRMRQNNMECNSIGLGINYSKDVGGGFYKVIKLDSATDSDKVIIRYCNIIFDRYYEFLPIRKVAITVGSLASKIGTQLNLFESFEDKKEEENINIAIDKIKDRFGKNSVLKASSLLKDSTIKERNGKVGGHNAE